MLQVGYLQREFSLINEDERIWGWYQRFMNQSLWNFKLLLEELGEDVDEESIASNFQQIAQQGDLSPRSVDKKKSGGKPARKQKEKIIPIRVQPKRSGLSSPNNVNG